MPNKRKTTSNDSKPSKKKKQENDEEIPLQFDTMSDEVFYEICSFVDAQTFNNLPLINRRVNEKFDTCLQNMIDYDELENIMEKKKISVPFVIWSTNSQSKIFKKYKSAHKLSLEVFFKALGRRPGGNFDEFIYKFIISFSGTKKPELKKGTIHNWDGEISARKMGNWKHSRDVHNLLKSLSTLSFETRNSTLGDAFFHTITDTRTDAEKYDTEWSSIELKAEFDGKTILKFHQKAIYPNDKTLPPRMREETPVTANPHALTMLTNLTTYCGLIKPINETENNSPAQSELGGREMKNFKEGISLIRCMDTVFN